MALAEVMSILTKEVVHAGANCRLCKAGALAAAEHKYAQYCKPRGYLFRTFTLNLVVHTATAVGPLRLWHCRLCSGYMVIFTFL